MSIREFIEKLAENRVDVWLDGDKLRYRAPKQALSPALMGELKAGKEALIAHLQEQQQQPFPLTYGQRALWFLHKTAPDSPAYNVAFSAVIASRFDSTVMQRALTYLHERHAALRLRFTDHAGEPLQYFSPDSTVDYQVIDASAWDDERVKTEVDNSYQAPFSLDETQALFRVRIFSRSSDSHIILIVFHHIIGDGWSLWLLLDELGQIYPALKAGQEPVLPATSVSYRGYALQQQQHLASAEAERDWAYWRDKFTDMPPLLNLPALRPFPAKRSYRGASYPLRIAGETVDKLRALAAERGVTLYVLLLAGYQLLLHRCCNQDLVCVGTPLAGRDDDDYANVVGYFVNPLPLLSKLDDRLSVVDFIDASSREILAAMAHQHFPLALVLERLPLARDTGRPPLFQAAFVFQQLQKAQQILDLNSTGGSGSVDWGGLRLSPYTLYQQEGQFDLSLELMEAGGDLIGTFKFNTDVLDRDDAARFADYYLHLLEALPDHKNGRAAELPLLNESYRSLMLQDWNATDFFTHSQSPDWECVSGSFSFRSSGDFAKLELREAWFPSGAWEPVNTSFRQGLPESSHREVSLGAGTSPKSSACAGDKLPSMALDSGIHAGMTALLGSTGLVYNDEQWNVGTIFITELLTLQARQTPDHPALLFNDETLSYRELEHRSNRLAHLLQQRGARPETLVAVSMERGFDLVIALHAIVKAGAAYVPLDPDYPKERLDYMINDAGAKLLLTQAHLRDRLGGYQGELLVINELSDEINQQPEHAPDVALHPDNMAYVIYTSGSTGQPKGVPNTHKGLLNRIQWMQRAYSLTEQDSVLQKTPYSFDVSVWEFFWPLITGGKLVIAKPGGHKDSAYLCSLIQRQQISTMHFVPSMLQAFIEDPDAKNCTSLTRIICSGEALPQELSTRVHNKLPAKLYNLYGPTEAAIDVSAWPAEATGVGSIVPIGRPIDNIQLYILDRWLQPTPVGVAGELYIAGIGLSRGYHGQAKLTAERFIPNPYGNGARLYRTGDISRYRPDGVIEYLGREDGQVKLRGFRIELGEIEAVLKKHAAVENCVVIADEVRGEKCLLAYLTLSEVGSDELRAYLQSALPDFMVPSAFIVLPEIPLSANGKVDRKALPAFAGEAPDAALSPPENEVQQRIADIWRQLLKHEAFGIHSDFFLVGGHSLLALRLVALLVDAFKTELSVEDVFGHATIARQAALLEKAAGQQNTWPAIAADAESSAPLAFSQERLWFMNTLENAQTVYHIPLAFHLRGVLHADALRQALHDLTSRQQALRTAFIEQDGRLGQQLIDPLDSLTIHARSAVRELGVEAILRKETETPFDLERGFVFKTALLDADDRHWILLLVVHHIVADGWSANILLDELSRLYRLQLGDGSWPLAALPVSYRDFCRWQRRLMDEGWFREAEAYWLDKLSGAPTQLALSYDKARPMLPGFRGAMRFASIDANTRTALQAFAQQHGATPFMSVLAAFGLVLYRYSGQTDFLVGTPAANRKRAEVHDLIGLFVNTVLMRFEIEPDSDFEQLLAALRQTALGAYQHQHYPFERLVDALQPVRDLAVMPLFQTMFVYQEQAPQALALPELDVEPIVLPSTVAKCDLSLYVTEQDEGWSLAMEYSTDLFHDETIAQMLAVLVTVITELAQNPYCPLSRVRLLSDDQQKRCLHDWNATDHELGTGLVPGLLTRQAQQTPDRPALVFNDETLSYSELESRANRLAHLLQQRGVSPETLVAVSMERSLDLVIALHAIVKAGAAYVPLDPDYPRERLDYMIADSGAKLLLTQAHLKDRLGAYQGERLVIDELWDEINQQPEHAPEITLHPDNIAYMIYTSGSTGQPKGVPNTHKGLLNRIQWMQRSYGLTEQDSVLQKTPYSFDVSVWEFFWPLVTGSKLVIAKPGGHKDSAYLCRLIQRQQLSTVHFVPSMLQAFIEDPDAKNCTSLTRIICSGEALPQELSTRVYNKLPAKLYNLYGPTEAAIDVSAWPAEAAGISSIVPIGRPIDNIQLYILDKQLRPVPVGVAGELCIAGIGLARGYHGQAKLTAERFIPNPYGNGARLYRTGDISRYRPDGVIEYLGREDGQIKLRGFRIELGEIEAVLKQYPGIKDAAVKVWDKRLVAYLVGAGIDEDGIKQHLQQLPDYMRPVQYVSLEGLPLTASGKLDRKALPQAEISARQTYVAPRNERERILAGIWRDVLHLTQIGIDDNYFELGGDSILSLQIISKAKQAGLKLRVEDLFLAQTIAELAAVAQTAGIENPRESAVEADRYPLTPTQTGILFHALYESGSAVYCQQIDLLLAGDLRVDLFRQAWRAVFKQHDALSMVFVWENTDQPYQHINPVENFSWTELDWRELADTEQRQRFSELMSQQAAQGFAVSRGPLAHFTLARLGTRQYRLLWSYHHLLMDGWSLPLVLGDVARYYAALLSGESYRPERSRPFADYVAWLSRQEAQGAQIYWQQQLAAINAATSIPCIDPDASEPAYHSTVLALDSVFSDELRAFVKSRHLTLAVVLQAAWALLLNRYSGETDVVFGITVSGRPAELQGVESVVGLFINTIPVAAKVDDAVEVSAWLQALAAAQFKREAHSYVPLAKITEWSPLPAGQALIQSLLVVENYPLKTGLIGNDADDLRIVDAQFTEQTNYPLTLVILPDDEIHIKAMYQGDVFDAETVARLLRHFRLALAFLAQSPAKTLGAFEVLQGQERELQLQGWNATAWLSSKSAVIPAGMTDPLERGSESSARDGTFTHRSQSPDWECSLGSSSFQYSGDFSKLELLESRFPSGALIVIHNAVSSPWGSDNPHVGRAVRALGAKARTARPTLYSGISAGMTVSRRLVYKDESGAWEPVNVETMLIPGLLTRQAQQTPDHPALVFNGETLSYNELESRSNRLAHLLQQRGAGPETLVAVSMERSFELVIALHAIVKAGAAYVPLDPDYPKERLDYMINDAGTKLLLTQAHLKDRLGSYQGERLVIDELWDEINQQPEHAPEITLHPDNIAYVIYTSGSTGQPKGVPNTHKGLLNRIQWMQRSYGLTEQDSVLQKTPYSFDVSVWEFFWPLVTGAKLVIAKPGGHKDSAYLCRLIQQQQVSTVHFVPSMLQAFIEDPEAQHCTSLTRIICSGEALPQELSTRVHGKLSTQLHNLYGPTEAAIDVSAWPAEATGRGSIVPIGRPIDNIQLYILDKRLQAVPIGVAGELYIAGIGLARGYHGKAKLTAERFIPNPYGNGARLYRTGDISRYRPDGVIEYLGREDGQVKLRGFRIELGEIEAVLKKYPGIKDAAVKVWESAQGKRLVAYLVGAGIDEDGIKQHLQQLPDYMRPAQFVSLDELPLTASGKLDRKALPQAEISARQTYVAPRNDREQILAGIWRDVLHLPQIGIDDNYFELGGDSILSLQIISRAKQAGLAFSLKQLFEAQTIAALAMQTQASAIAGAEQGSVSGAFAATPIQSFFFASVQQDAHHFNQSVLLEVAADLDDTALALAVDALLKHHDALRLGFTLEGGHASLVIKAESDIAEVFQTGVFGTAKDLTTQAQRIQASFNADHGALIRVVHFHGADQGLGRLLLVVHHLAVDGVSWRIVLEDLHRAYRAAAQGEKIQLPQKTTSYIRWSECLRQWAAERPDQAYWRQQAATPLAELTPDHADAWQAITLADTAVESLQWDGVLTRALMQAPRLLQAGVEEVLLAALVESLWERLGKQALSIELEGHGREDLFNGLDLSRTVGWFTSLFPLAVTADGTALEAVKSAYRALPNRGLSYGVLRYLSDDLKLREQLVGAASTGLRFNYLGRFSRAESDAVFIRQALEDRGDERSPRQLFDVLIDVNSAVHDDCLHIDWRYSPLQFRRESIHRLLDAFAQNLKRLLPNIDGMEAPDAQTSDAIEDIYALSPLQQGLLFHSIYAQESASYLQQVSWRFNGRLDADAWRSALQQLLQRHPVLRTGFDWRGAEPPLQIVYKTLELPWREADLSRLDSLAQQQAVADWLAEDRLHAFNTAVAPLMRCALLQLGEDRHYFVWTYHHILFDGWSLPKLLEDLFALYAANMTGRPANLPQRRPFKAYIDWLAVQDAEAMKRYWTAQLDGFTTPHHLAVDLGGEAHSRQAQYDELSLHLDEHLTADIDVYARANHVTLNAVLQGAWAILLSRYCNSRDIVFGATVAGRPDALAGVEDSIGLYINTVPVRVQVSTGLSPGRFLRQLFADNTERLQYAHAQLAELQRWSPVDGGQALFDTLFIFENYPLAETLEQESAELKLDAFQVLEQTDLPLTLLITPGTRLALKISYQQQRFEAAAIEALLGHYRQILRAIASAQSLDHISLLTEDEQAGALADTGLNMAADYVPHADTLPGLITRQIRLSPEHIAVRFAEQALTYAELERQSNRLANVLLAQGAAPEKIVAVCIDRCELMVVALLAVLKTGAAYLPLDPQLPTKRVQQMVVDSGALLVLAKGPSLSLDYSAAVLDVENLPETSATPIPNIDLHPDNLAYVIYTSGSTGTPKGVQISHRAIVNFLRTTLQKPGLTGQDKLLAVTTPAFDIAALELYLPLCTGASVVIADSQQTADGYALAELLQRHDITAMQATPATWRLLLAAGWRGSPAFKALCGGEALSPKLAAQLHECAGQVWNLYGPTETTVWSMRWLLDGSATVKLGAALGNTRLYIVDDNLNLLPPGIPGELMIAGAGVARGYRNRAGLTAERFVPDPFSNTGERMYRTGDQVRRLDDGSIEYLGRLDFQAKVRGYRIELGEIESVLEQHPGIQQAVAVISGSDDSSVALIAYYCGDSVSDAVLRGWCAETLPVYMVPGDFIRVASFALTHSGKVDRKALPKPERRVRADSPGPLQSASERLIGEIWREVLQRDDFGRDDNFFDSGGHSLLLMQVWHLLQQKAQHNLQTVDLFRYPTIAKLAERLDQSAGGRDGEPAAAVKRAGQRAQQQKNHRLGRARR